MMMSMLQTKSQYAARIGRVYSIIVKKYSLINLCLFLAVLFK